jgi:hypothetical protein
MLSKCANPEGSEIFRYLHQGKIFCLAPTPEIEVAAGMPNPVPEERFWLCERCAKRNDIDLGWSAGNVGAPAHWGGSNPAGSSANEGKTKTTTASTGHICRP